VTKLQFRVLYREFLFRMVDLELLSAHAMGDMSRLFGQFAALLISLSILLSVGALGFGGRMPPQKLLIASWSMEHTLIATNMLVVGLFAILSWDSTFPDRRDVLVLAPLPVRARTLFLAKVAALVTALSVTVVTLNSCTGLVWPLALAPAGSGILGLIRSFFAYWVTMLLAGVFIVCSILSVQGLAAQLPRRQFLRVSAFLQMAAFSLFVTVYFLQPSLTTPQAITAAQNQRALACLPSYWFLGLFQMLNGSMDPALAQLAWRAWIGLAVAGSGAASAFLLSYFRTLRKIVEEPDIVSGSGGVNWAPRFGSLPQTAIVLFSVRTLLRSRQHRLILAFYLGIGFAIVILLAKDPAAQQQALTAPRGILGGQVNVPLLISSVVMLCAAVVGTRIVFSMPLDLRANWIFRVAAVRGGLECLAASRRSLLVLAVTPVWAASAVLFLSIWPWRPVAGHLVVLGLLGMILADLGLHGFQKIPFTCSYLPGKTYVHLVVLPGLGLMTLILKGTAFERRALENPATYVRMLVILVIAAICVRWRTVALAKSEDTEVQFEDVLAPAIFVLGLCRDGVVPMEATPTRPPIS
jgi:hypothetical protein